MSQSTGLRSRLSSGLKRVNAILERRLGALLPERFAPWAPALPWVTGTAVFAAVIVIALGSLAGSGRSASAEQPALAAAGSSWVTGEPSLAENAQFAALVGPAAQLAQQRFAERQQLIALLAARKLAVQRRARDLARQRYLEARRRALQKYREALRRNAIERAKALKKQAEAKKRYEAALRAFNRKRQIAPGKECGISEVKQSYQCHTGLTPIPKTKKKAGHG
jgi:hypothetical protein